MNKYEEDDEPGLILLIDFEKAFDMIAWDFIHHVLKIFAFPNYLIRWIYLFQKGAYARVSQNGWLS